MVGRNSETIKIWKPLVEILRIILNAKMEQLILPEL